MDPTTPTETFRVPVSRIGSSDPSTPAAIESLEDIDGVESVQRQENELIIHYQPFVISEEGLRRRLQAAGVEPRSDNGPKPSLWRRFVERLATENRSSLGGKPLDCCDLNKSNRPS